MKLRLLVYLQCLSLFPANTPTPVSSPPGYGGPGHPGPGHPGPGYPGPGYPGTQPPYNYPQYAPGPGFQGKKSVSILTFWFVKKNTSISCGHVHMLVMYLQHVVFS